MSLATTFSLWSMQCVIHGSCTVCAHRDTFWPGYIMFTEKIVDHFENLWTFFYLQAAAYRIEIPPASHFGRQITKKLKAERRLTHRWIHLIVVQNNLPSGVLRLVVPSHQLPIQFNRAGIGMLFSFFTYSSFPNIVLHISLAVGNIKLSAIMYGCLVWATRNATW